MKVPCQPMASIKYPVSGANMAVPRPPAAHRMPIPSPRLRRNQPLTAAINGTIANDCVSDNKTPKKMKNCQTSRTWLSKIMLIRNMVAEAVSIFREP